MIKKILHKTCDTFNTPGAFAAVFILAVLSLLPENFISDSKAASSDWQDIGGGKARLVANLDPATNRISGVIEVKLEQGWSTYWRYPGSSGIPPVFNFSKSEAVSVGKVSFPTPTLIEQEFGSYAGYKNKVMFPFEADLLSTSGGKINLDLLIGVCEKVCIPAKAEMNIKVSDLFQSDSDAVRTISFAKITVPKKMPANEVITQVHKADDGLLHIKVKHDASLGKPALFVEGPREWYLTPAKLISQEKGIATFELDVSNAPLESEILSEKLRFTLATGSTGIEIEH